TTTIPVPPAPPAAPPPPPEAPPSAPPPPPPPEPEPTEPEIFEVSEVQPELIGGLEGLQARVVYPPLAVQAGVSGQVVVQFVVDERGNVIDPVILRSPNDLLSEAAVEAVVASRFTPGTQRGRPVRVRYAVPVRFELR
ncbi:MAG: energy transducer TonB, partial [Bacteroidota bacterium]